MKNLSILEVVKCVELNADSLFDLVEVYGLQRAVELQAKMELFYILKDSTDNYVTSKDIVRLVNNLYTLHRPSFENQAKVAFAKEYK